MTLTQLNAFVLVARLGSVTAAANALGVSEPAVSQALAALRQHLGDQLVSRGPSGMTLTAGGSRLLATASQIVVLGAEAHAAVRAAQGAPEQLRVVASSTVAEFVSAPLIEAFTKRFAGRPRGLLRASPSPRRWRCWSPTGSPTWRSARTWRSTRACRWSASRSSSTGWSSSPAGTPSRAAPPSQWRWLVDPSATDPGSDVGQFLAQLRIPEDRIGVCPSQTAAWAAAADGDGVSLAVEHLVAQQLRRGELVAGRDARLAGRGVLVRDDARAAAAQRRGELAAPVPGTPEAMQLMRAPAAGVPPSRFRPPVYVTIWS